MADGDFSFTKQAEDDAGPGMEDLDYDYTLHDNVAEDVVRYSRSRIVKNEQQFLLTTLGYVSGFMENPSHYVSGVLIGTAGAGKTHLQHQLEKLFPDAYLYQTTSGSEKSIIYDDAWEDAYIASLDELQKPGETIIEILKSLHGDDEEYTYQVTGDGRGADRDVDEITRTAIPYWFLYAQYEPDFEMWDRLLKVPVHESREKNEGVLATKWDHSMIEFGDSDNEYIFDFEDGMKALKDHIRDLPKNAWVKIPAGEEEYGWDAHQHAKAIFDIDRSETNRTGAMVANLVRASALLNHEKRDRRKVHVQNEGVKNAIVAAPQDLANVLSCRDVLLATTHQLDRKKKALCLAIEQEGGTKNQASIPDLMEHLRKTNASFVKRSQIEQMLGDLIDNHLVEKHEGAGQNGRNLYEFSGWQDLGKFEIDDEFERVFDECVDPIQTQKFVETARETNAELKPKASDFMTDTEVEAGSDDERQQKLVDDDSAAFDDIDLEPHEEAVREALRETVHERRIEDLDEREPGIDELVGVVDFGEDADGRDVSGTLFDPEHEVWTYGPDDWVEDRSDAEREVDKAVRKLTEAGIVKMTTLRKRGSQPLAMKITVASETEVHG